jgi:four helix bundle protein
MPLQSYKDLLVWQASRRLVKDVYELSSLLPKTETYGLMSQIQRAAVSIPSNIAEGYRRNNRGEYVQFLGIASGSAAELETQLILINDVFRIETDACLKKLTEVQKMLVSLIRKLDPKP